MEKASKRRRKWESFENFENYRKEQRIRKELEKSEDHKSGTETTTFENGAHTGKPNMINDKVGKKTNTVHIGARKKNSKISGIKLEDQLKRIKKIPDLPGNKKLLWRKEVLGILVLKIDVIFYFRLFAI